MRGIEKQRLIADDDVEQRKSDILMQMGHIRNEEHKYVSEYVKKYDLDIEYDMQLIYKRRREAREKYTGSSEYRELQAELIELAGRGNVQK